MKAIKAEDIIIIDRKLAKGLISIIDKLDNQLGNPEQKLFFYDAYMELVKAVRK